jgi:hypothetical protein
MAAIAKPVPSVTAAAQRRTVRETRRSTFVFTADFTANLPA